MATTSGRAGGTRSRSRLGKALRRLLSGIGWLVAVLLVLYVCAPSLILPTLVREYGLPELERALGSRLDVERVSVGHLGAVTLEGVTVRDPAGGGPMLLIPRLEARPDVPRLVAGEIQFHLVRLHQPLLRVRIHPDGTTNLDRAIAGLGIVPVEGTEVPGVRVDRLEVHLGRVLIDEESQPFAAELTGLEVVGFVDGAAQQSSFTGTALAFGGAVGVSFGVRGATPDVPEGVTRLSVGWAPAGPRSGQPVEIGPLRAVTGGDVTVDLGPGPLGAMRGRIELREARLRSDGLARPAVEAAWLEVQPDVLFQTSSPLTSLSGAATGGWRDARVEGEIDLDGVGLGGLADSLTLVSAGHGSVGLDGGRVTSIRAMASVRDAVLVRAAPSPGSALRVPVAEVGADLSLDAGGRPSGLLDVRAEGIDLNDALALLARDRFPDGRPRAGGLVQAAARLAFDRDGPLRVAGTGRVDAFRADVPGEADGPATTGTVAFDLSGEVSRQGDGQALVRGAARYTVAGVALGPVLAEADRLWPTARLSDVPAAGVLDGWGTVRVDRDTDGRRVALAGAGALRRPRLGGVLLGGDPCRVEALCDLHIGPGGSGLAGQAHLTGRAVDLPAFLAALGLPDAAGRCDGSFDLRLTLDVAGSNPMRIQGNLAGDRVGLVVRGRRLSWERVHAAPRFLVALSRGQVDLETATVSASGVEGQIAGSIQRGPNGRWRGGVNGLVKVDGAAALEQLRAVGLEVPPAIRVAGTVPMDVDVSFGEALVRVSGRGHLADGVALAWGRFVRIDPGTPSDLRFAIAYEAGPRVLRVESVSMALPGVTGEVKGLFDLAKGTADLSGEAIVSDVAAAGQLCPAAGDLDLAGRGTLQARLTGPLKSAVITGTVHLDGLAVAMGRGTDDGLQVSGDVRLDGWHAAWDDVALVWRGDDLRLGGEADLSPGKRPSARLRVTGKRLRLDRSGGGAGGRDVRAAARAAAAVEATVTAMIDRVDLGFLSLDAVSTTVHVAEGRLRLDPAVALLEGAAVSGPADLDLTDTEPALRLALRAIGLRQEGRVAEFVRDNASILHLTGLSNVEGSLAVPLAAEASRSWPTGELRAVCQGGRLQGPTGPDWLPRLFNGLRLDRYPFRTMSVRAVFEGGNDVRLVAFLDAESLPDLVVEVRATSAGTLRVDAGVDLLATVNPTPDLFREERPYVVSIYRSQEAWVAGRRVIHSGGFRTAPEVSYDVFVRRNAVVQTLRSTGGELAKVGLRALDTFVPLRAIEEILGWGWRRPPAPPEE